MPRFDGIPVNPNAGGTQPASKPRFGGVPVSPAPVPQETAPQVQTSEPPRTPVQTPGLGVEFEQGDTERWQRGLKEYADFAGTYNPLYAARDAITGAGVVEGAEGRRQEAYQSLGFFGVPGFESEGAVEAREMGISNEGAPEMARMVNSFAGDRGLFTGNDAKDRAHVQRSLELHFKQPIELKETPTGQIYFQGEGIPPTVFDPDGLERGDFADFTGDAVAISPEIGGALAGAGAGSLVAPGPGTIVGGIGGGAGGAFLGEYLRLTAGNEMGLSNEDLAAQALENLGLSVAGGLASTALAPIIRLVSDKALVGKGVGVKRDIAKIINENRDVFDDANAKITRLNEALPAGQPKFEPTLPQMVDDARLDSYAEQARRHPQVGQLIDQREKEQARALEGISNNTRAQFDDGTVGQTDLGEQIKGAVDPRVNAARARISRHGDERLNGLQQQIDAEEAAADQANRQISQNVRAEQKKIDLDVEQRQLDLNDQARRNTQAARRQADLQTDQAAQGVEDAAAALGPRQAPGAVGRDVRQGALEEAKDAARWDAKAPFKQLDKNLGDVKSTQPARRRALQNQLAEGERSTTPSSRLADDQAARMDLRSMYEEKQVNQHASKIVERESSVADLMKDRSDKLATLRKAQSGVLPDRGDKALSTEVEALDRDIEHALKNHDAENGTGLLDQWRGANEKYAREYVDVYERSVVGDVLSKSGGQYRVNDEQVVSRLLQKDSKGNSDAFFDILDKPGFSGQKAAVRGSLASMYDQQVMTKTGRARKLAHDRFMDDYGHSVERLWDGRQSFDDVGKAIDSELDTGKAAKIELEDASLDRQAAKERTAAQYRNEASAAKDAASVKGDDARRDVAARLKQQVGALSREAEQTRARTKRTLERLNSTFQGQIKDLDAEEIYSKLVKQSDSKGYRKNTLALKKLLKTDHPEVWKHVVALKARDVHKTITGRTADSGGRAAPQFANLDKMLDDVERVQDLRAVFGQRYVDDLKVLRDGIEVASRKNKFRADIPQVDIFDLLRVTVAPPLTREGRIVTAGKKFSKNQALAVVEEAIMDPDKMVKFADLIRRREKGPKLDQAIGSIIGTSGNRDQD